MTVIILEIWLLYIPTDLSVYIIAMVIGQLVMTPYLKIKVRCYIKQVFEF